MKSFLVFLLVFYVVLVGVLFTLVVSWLLSALVLR